MSIASSILSHPAKLRAIVCTAAGGVMLLIAANLAWGAVNRWLAVGHLRDHERLLLAGDVAGARAAGREAWSYEPGAVTALAAADLTSAEAVPALQAAAHGATANDRAALASAIALAQGQPADGFDPDAGDAPLLQAMKVGKVGPVTLDRDHPPHLAVLAAWGVSRLQAAWQAGSRSDVVAAASLLLTVAPHHPQAAELQVLVAALGPNAPTKGAFITLASAIPDTARRQALGQRLIALAPERTIIQILNAGATHDDGSDPQLSGLVAAALAQPETIREGLVIRCLQAGNPGLAERLANAKPAMAALLAPLSDKPWPASSGIRITTPQVMGDQIAFHFSNAAGALPRTTPQVSIGKVPVAPNDIRRIGTLILVPWRSFGAQVIIVRYQDKDIFAAEVHP